ncbi:tetratricopeptide repeat protein [Salegentibacter sp. LM13S]|uniref:tetratricopeptide repeat-containing sensor histidine kinase n=1 Tax=Salegentibacter lacus TaxID=2873599 RepID=UPI001CCA1B2F|nr:tetratricopeptide repeat-containing sensor histidine kinase [Salegentibacter lacus]MBZ9632482.1 tetratricopeptide repeat protein [Salegentibacter lacus]
MRTQYSFLLLFVLLLSLTSCKDNNQVRHKNSKPTLDEIFSDTTLNKTQKKQILDSAYSSISTIQNDSLKNDNLLEISYQYLMIKDSVKFLCSNSEARNIFFRIKDSARIAATYWDLGNFYQSSTKDSAYFYYTNAHRIYQNLGEEFNSARLLLNMALVQKNVKDYTGSEVTTIKAITLLKSLKKYKQLYSAYNNLGIIFNELQEYEKALENYKIALNYLEMSGREYLYPSLWNNIGVVYQNSGRHKEALANFQKAMNYNQNIKTTDPKMYAMILDNSAYVKLFSKDTIGIHKDFLEALEIRKNLNINDGITINQLHLAEYFLEKKDSVTAINYALATKELALKIQNTRDYLSSLKFLSNTVKDSALNYSQEYIKINDSLQKRERAVRNKFARIRFETEGYISETKRLNDRILQTSLISAGVILIIILLYIISNQRAKNKLIKQKQTANQEIYNLVIDQQKKFEEGRDTEKQYISRELHDGILGKLFGIRLNLDSLNEEDDSESKSERFKYIREIQKISDQIRLLSHRLNKTSLTNVNFETVLEELVKSQNAGKIKFHIEFKEAINWDTIDNNIKINIYRILQEAISNIHKHAKATEARIKFDNLNDQLIISIADNGIGFYPEKIKNGIGLSNIYARVKKIKGKINISSLGENRKGTTLKLTVPLS